MGSVTSIFQAPPVDFNREPGADPWKHEYPLVSPENKALALATAERFDLMCHDILWGTEDEQAFGEMLRGLVLTFAPNNRFHLQLLRNIAAVQWQLQRIGAVQGNLFENGKGRAGKYGLPVGTLTAMEYRPEASQLLRDLRLAISTYRTVREG